MVVGAPDYDGSTSEVGRAFVLWGGSPSGALDEGAQVWLGASEEDSAGEYVHALGDINGDDLDDVLIVSMKEDTAHNNAGASYGILGGSQEGTFELVQSADIVILGATSNDYFGRGVASVGDLDNDGFDDFWLTSSAHGNGKAYLLYGGVTP